MARMNLLSPRGIAQKCILPAKSLMHSRDCTSRHCLSTQIDGVLKLSFVKGPLLFNCLDSHWLVWPEMNALRHSARIPSNIFLPTPTMHQVLILTGDHSKITFFVGLSLSVQDFFLLYTPESPVI